MKHTESIANLAAALVAAQADIKAVAKTSTNPHYKSKYASLDTMVETVRPALAKHGLVVIQGATAPITDSDGALAGFDVETMLVHKSGEWLSNSVIMPLTKSDAQGAGSAMTYGRRYGLSALLSLATDDDDDDDDGHTASAPRAASAPATRSAPASNGGHKTMPFGKNKGKTLGQLPSEELQKTVKWCKETDAEKFKDLIASCNAILNDRALGTTPRSDDEAWAAAVASEDAAGSELPF